MANARTRRSCVSALVFALASMWCADARTESATSALSWVRLPGAETCISTPELGSRIEKHLGRAVLVSPSVADVSIEGRIASTGVGAGRRYRATVGGTRRDGTPIGTREITSSGAECGSLDDGLVLVIALMIDPNALEPSPPRESPPPPSPIVTREIIHERTIVHEPPAVSPPSAWVVQGAAVGVASIERLPGVAPGLGIALRGGPTKLAALELSLGIVPSTSLEVGSRSVELGLFEAGLAYCPGVGLGPRVEAIGCVGMRAGAIRSRGRGFSTDTEVERGLADIALGPRVLVTLVGPVFAVVSLTALVPLVRQETTARNRAGESVVLHERSVFGAEAAFGLGLHFSP
jgi:hypothetical protein